MKDFTLFRQIANLGLLAILIETFLDHRVLIVTSNLQRAIKEGKSIKVNIFYMLLVACVVGSRFIETVLEKSC